MSRIMLQEFKQCVGTNRQQKHAIAAEPDYASESHVIICTVYRQTKHVRTCIFEHAEIPRSKRVMPQQRRAMQPQHISVIGRL